MKWLRDPCKTALHLAGFCYRAFLSVLEVLKIRPTTSMVLLTSIPYMIYREQGRPRFFTRFPAYCYCEGEAWQGGGNHSGDLAVGR